MGGNVFKGSSRRYMADEYKVLESEVVKKLASLFVDSAPLDKSIKPIPYYRTKESFGDMDIIVNSKYLKPDYTSIVVSEFGLRVKEWERNGDALSFLYKDFQIDLIITKDEDFQSSIDYFSWNDLGNLIGRISHKFGLKFGHTGTHIVIKNDDYVIGSILVTKDINEFLSFLDLDVDKFLSGFDTMEEAYQWLVKSKYFNKEIYSLDNRNHTARMRDRKRQNYTNFLIWVEEQSDIPEYPYTEISSRGGYNIREPFFTMICEAFPHVKPKYEELINTYMENKKFTDKFNGKLVMEYTGLEGKSLGEFMTWARKEIDRTDIKHMFLKLSSGAVKILIEYLFYYYNNNKPFERFNYQMAVKISRHDGLVQM